MPAEILYGGLALCFVGVWILAGAILVRDRATSDRADRAGPF
jgi:hypothetical protein